MPYFKHAELVKQYHVSLKTVHNWIDAAKQGKIDLSLHEHGTRIYIANTASNIVTLKKLSDQGKKYRNNRYHEVATPAPAFYDLFTRKQILDIITNLNVYGEIPRQYNYVGEGAQRWDEYTRRLVKEGTSNLVEHTAELLRANQKAIDRLLQGHSRVNVVDVGPGNGLPVRELLEHLHERGLLHRYIAIDISEEMLRIVERNITEWFGGKIKFEGYIRDVSYERFDDILVDDMLGREGQKTINLVLLLGQTPENFRDPTDILRVVHDSMGYEDVLVVTTKPDSETARRYFALSTGTNGTHALSPIHSHIFSLLNIDESLYDVEMGFNEQKRVRYIQVRFKKDLTIQFTFKDGERSVDFNKGETILLWRAWHFSVLELITTFEEVGLALLQASITKDRQYLLTVSGVEAKATR